MHRKTPSLGLAHFAGFFWQSAQTAFVGSDRRSEIGSSDRAIATKVKLFLFFWKKLDYNLAKPIGIQ
jgi:hypothetical protein